MPAIDPPPPGPRAVETGATRRVLARLRQMIVRGDLAPGTRIVERALCADFAVSRTPMREALKLLEIDGLIELSPNRGARVRVFTEHEAVELFETLAGLESLAAELATERMSGSDLDALTRCHEQMAAHYRARRLDEYFDINSAMHERIVELTGNTVLLDVYRSLMLRAKRSRYMAILDKARWRQAMDEHDALIDALTRRNAADAGRIWRAHLTHTGQTVAAVLREDALRRAAS